MSLQWCSPKRATNCKRRNKHIGKTIRHTGRERYKTLSGRCVCVFHHLLSFSSFRLAQRNERHKLKSIANIDIVFYLVYIYIYFFFVSLPSYFFTFLPFYKVPKVLQDDDCQNEEQEQVKSFPSEEISEGEPCLYVLVQIVAIISYHGTTDDDA